VNPEWGLASANRSNQVLQPARQIDVLNPDYQRVIGEVAQDLLLTDIDGIVFEARRAKGFAEEWSPTSRRIFEESFGSSTGNQDQSTDTWRWAGWKTRTYLGFVTRFNQQLRQKRSGLLAAVAVHERAVLSPVDALTEYGEDILETKQRGLHVV